MEVGGKEANVQVITMEENGRLGNLLTEMATLLLLGRRANVTVSLLPQVPLPCAFISGQFICIKHNRYCQNMNLYNIFPTDFCHKTTLQVAEKLSPFLYPLPLDVIDQKGFTFRGRSHITSAARGGRGGKPKADNCQSWKMSRI